MVNGVLVELNPGDICASLRYLSERWKWSIKRVRTYLALLEADRMVERRKTGEGKQKGTAKAHPQTVLTLVNYRKYAIPTPNKGTPGAHQGHGEGTAGAQIEEGEEGQQGEGAPPPAQASEPKPLCTLSQALEVGQRNRMTPGAIRYWWHDRNSRGWRKGGPGSPLITSWQSDLATCKSWAEEGAAKSQQTQAKATTPQRCT